MVPISINPFAVDILEIKTVYHGILTVNIHGRHTVQSVSYTHLDVYKRQEVWDALANSIRSIDKGHLMTFHPRGRTTVSYTHLDVYKRQLLECVFVMRRY